MGAKHNPKRDKHIQAVADAVSKLRKDHINPEILFGRASNDDLNLYTAQMLALTSLHAHDELLRWENGERPRISIETIDGISPSGAAVSVVAVTDRNMPFLYDSVMGEVTSTHRDIHLAIHPIIVREPGKPSKLFSPDEKSDPDSRISHIQIHLSELTGEEASDLKRRLATVLEQVHLAVRDWDKMRTLLDEATSDLSAYNASRKKSDRDEAIAFLEWLRDNNFTFLGMREYTYSGMGRNATVERGSGVGLGILSDPDVRVLRQGKDTVTTTPEILAFLDGPDFLIVTKANVKSVVHRRTYMDYIGIKRFDAKGTVIGELRAVGLFTSTAYTRAAADIPLLRSKISKIVDHFGYDPQSHSGKMLMNTLESYPRDDLFQIDPALLATFCEQINDLADRPRVRVLPRIDHFDRFVSVLVYVPREQYDSDVREKIGNYLKTVYDGRVSAYYPAFPEGGLTRVHFIIGRSGAKTPRIAQAKLEDAIRDIATRWTDRFNLLARDATTRIAAGQAYQSAFTPAEAFEDFADIAACKSSDPIRISFYRKRKAERAALELKIFHAGMPVSLSRRVPLLENLGFRVVSEQTYDINVMSKGAEDQLVVLHDMELEHRDGVETNLQKSAEMLEEAFLAAWNGETDDDGLNRLVLLAGLNIREINVLRAYSRYLRQTGITYSQGYIADTLNKYPVLASSIFAFFRTRLEPQLADKQRTKRGTELLAGIETALSAVPSLDEDRILRRFVNAIEATLRTNYFQTDAGNLPPAVMAFKFDPKRLDGLPEPRPFREIFIYGTEVEGVHLRFGKVARGGLRWSDRAQDYRTEVLGLVKAQQVKNAVIVPVGAKGGFYPKQLPANGTRDEIFKAGTEAYKTYIRTLLSITDNIVGPDVMQPADTLCLDGEDPYFVVAADKGTATFSDTANGLAQEAGFWLDDAFASGGSVGYDHKKMGITARGAWEAVKRHFREMDIDIQSTPFSVVGVGDMSGDVFGNGMLLSRKIRLIAAFDHRDIFIDPNPDTERSFIERQRLFELPRSSWQDYERAKLSSGGMIISRAEKSVTLTAEAAAAIGLDKQKATPFEILSAILKAPVDLLWFGGIGTYIRGQNETDLEVGDRTNDPIRVTAEEVRAKVIGEGANLGVTQKGRIGFGLAGGRCNSDAIDNSAGVNSSDVEVNIKIALASAMREDRLTRLKRNTLLASMTDEVAKLVLRNNYLQSLAISLTEKQGTANRTPLMRLMNTLETSGNLNRKVEILPTDGVLSERYQAGKPLTRAEIGVLLSYAKIVLFEDIVRSDLPDDPYLTETLENYFPEKMQKLHREDIRSHRLRREIIATILANTVINRGGPAFSSTLTDATGFLPAQVVKAAVIAHDGYELTTLYDQADALDTLVPGSVQNELYEDIGQIYATVTNLVLTTGMVKSPIEDAVGSIRIALQKLKPGIDAIVPDSISENARLRAEYFVSAGVPAELAQSLASLSVMTLVPEIMQISAESRTTLPKTAQGYFGTTQQLRIARLINAAQRIAVTDQYEAMALARSVGDITNARRSITMAALAEQKQTNSTDQQAPKGDQTARVVEQLVLLTESGEITLAKISVAAGLLGDLAQNKGR